MVYEFDESSEEWGGTSVKHYATDSASIAIDLADAESIVKSRRAFIKALMWLWPDQNAVINEETKQQMWG